MSNKLDTTLLARAARVFGDQDKARHWLTREQRCFEGMTPLVYATTSPGMAAVLAHLSRIEHGVYP